MKYVHTITMNMIFGAQMLFENWEINAHILFHYIEVKVRLFKIIIK